MSDHTLMKKKMEIHRNNDFHPWEDQHGPPDSVVVIDKLEKAFRKGTRLGYDRLESPIAKCSSPCKTITEENVSLPKSELHLINHKVTSAGTCATDIGKRIDCRGLENIPRNTKPFNTFVPCPKTSMMKLAGATPPSAGNDVDLLMSCNAPWGLLPPIEEVARQSMDEEENQEAALHLSPTVVFKKRCGKAMDQEICSARETAQAKRIARLKNKSTSFKNTSLVPCMPPLDQPPTWRDSRPLDCLTSLESPEFDATRGSNIDTACNKNDHDGAIPASDKPSDGKVLARRRHRRTNAVILSTDFMSGNLESLTLSCDGQGHQ